LNWARSLRRFLQDPNPEVSTLTPRDRTPNNLTMPKKTAHDAAKEKRAKTEPTKPKRTSRAKTTAASDTPRGERGQFNGPNPHTWKPGQSGNPNGRPKAKTLSEAIREQLARACEEDTEGRSWAEVVAEQLVKVAAGKSHENSTNAVREICDRTEGKPRQPVELDATGEARRMLSMLLGVSEDELPEAPDES
jgi:hypothetical protein